MHGKSISASLVSLLALAALTLALAASGFAAPAALIGSFTPATDKAGKTVTLTGKNLVGAPR